MTEEKLEYIAQPMQRPELDNWKHRSTNMRCRTCMFFVAKLKQDMQDKDILIGRCREGSPTMKGWPVMFADDWCGAHKLDENKI